MTFIPMSEANIQLMIQNNVQQWRATILWLEERVKSYGLNMTTQNMTAAGISTADQNAILAFISDINKVYGLATGVMPSSANDMLFDCAAILGVA